MSKEKRTMTEEHKRKLSKSIKAALARPEVKAKMMGREVSKETRDKIGKANSIVRKGMKLSDAHRKSMSIERIERYKNPEYREKHRASIKKAYDSNPAMKKGLSTLWVTGEKHQNWKGGITPENKTQRNRFKSEIKDIILIRDNYTCQICDVTGGDMHVDHIKPWVDYPDLRFELSNCRTLCRPCHYYITFKRKMPDKSKWGQPQRNIKNLNQKETS